MSKNDILETMKVTKNFYIIKKVTVLITETIETKKLENF